MIRMRSGSIMTLLFDPPASCMVGRYTTGKDKERILTTIQQKEQVKRERRDKKTAPGEISHNDLPGGALPCR
jgi:hypothetical protein